ncbi:hypothetical protein OROHE_020738 [Orobanche hederae]
MMCCEDGVGHRGMTKATRNSSNTSPEWFGVLLVAWWVPMRDPRRCNIPRISLDGFGGVTISGFRTHFNSGASVCVFRGSGHISIQGQVYVYFGVPDTSQLMGKHKCITGVPDTVRLVHFHNSFRVMARLRRRDSTRAGPDDTSMECISCHSLFGDLRHCNIRLDWGVTTKCVI